jgi:hypothetical protein
MYTKQWNDNQKRKTLNIKNNNERNIQEIAENLTVECYQINCEISLIFIHDISFLSCTFSGKTFFRTVV